MVGLRRLKISRVEEIVPFSCRANLQESVSIGCDVVSLYSWPFRLAREWLCAMLQSFVTLFGEPILDADHVDLNAEEFPVAFPCRWRHHSDQYAFPQCPLPRLDYSRELVPSGVYWSGISTIQTLDAG